MTELFKKTYRKHDLSLHFAHCWNRWTIVFYIVTWTYGELFPYDEINIFYNYSILTSFIKNVKTHNH